MKARQAHLAAVAAAVLLLAGCRVERRERAAVVNTDSVARLEIRATSDRYRRALMAGNPAAAAAFFTDSARMEAPGLPRLEGVDAIRGMFRDAFGMARVEMSEMTPETMDFGPPGVAWEAGTYVERFRMNGDSAGTQVEGAYALRWRRGVESTWQIDRMILWHPPVSADSTAPQPDSTASQS